MSSVVPTPDEMKRQMKMMRKLHVVDADPSTPPPTPRQQKKIGKALRKIIIDTMGDGSSEMH